MTRKIVQLTLAAMNVVAIGVAINRGYEDGEWQWPWVALAVILALLSGLAVWAQERRSQPGAQEAPPPPIAAVSLSSLGVHRSEPVVVAYVPRDVDTHLRELISSGQPLVLVEGPRLAGATRTLAEATRAELPDDRVLVRSDPSRPLRDLVDEAGGWVEGTSGVVLWLDAVVPEQLRQIDAGLLADVPDRVRILGTVDGCLLDGYQVPVEQTELLDRYICPVGELSSEELAAFEHSPAYPSAAPSAPVLIGRALVELDRIRRLLTNRGTDPKVAIDRLTLLQVVTDWDRLALPGRLDEVTLRSLYAEYRRDISESVSPAAVSHTGYKRALDWAKTTDRPLVDLVLTDRGVHHRPHPLLTYLAGEQTGWAIRSPLWQFVEETSAGDERLRLGIAAVEQHAFAPAERLLRQFAGSEIPVHTMAALAVGLTDQPESAQKWYTAVVDTGDIEAGPPAMCSLAVLAAEAGLPETATRWWLSAVDSGHPDASLSAMRDLAEDARERGEFDESSRWFTTVIERQDPRHTPPALLGLALLQKNNARLDEAHRLLLLAIEWPHPVVRPRAMGVLASLAHEANDVDAARRWYLKAIAIEVPEEIATPMYHLAILEREQERPVDARHWYEQAIAADHPDITPQAMNNFGLLELDEHHVAEARGWFVKTIATAYPDAAPQAMSNLGTLELREKRGEQAWHWYKKAVATKHPDAAPGAMISLGNLEATWGNFPDAEYWYEQAISTGHDDDAPFAMVCRGDLEAVQKNLDEARKWYAKAAASGHGKHAARAERALKEINSAAAERREARGSALGSILCNPEEQWREGVSRRLHEGLEDDKP